MIIKVPTGAFARELPTVPEDSRSVTYTISNNPPPPTIPSFVVSVPLGVLNGQPPVDEKDRTSYGELLFTIVQGTKYGQSGSSKKAYEPGEIIEFEAETTAAISSLPNTAQLTIQHITNVLDLSSLGLNDDEVKEIKEASEAKFNIISAEITKIQSVISALKIEIIENQKAINEANKAIKAVENIYGETDLDGNVIYGKLLTKMADLELIREQLITDLNSQTILLKENQDQLIKVSQLVR